MAITHVWNGCLSLLVLPIFVTLLWGYLIKLWIDTLHWPRSAAPFAVGFSFFVLCIFYVAYAWIGVGLWNLRPWARLAELVLLTSFGVICSGVSLIFIRPLVFASTFVICYGLGFGWMIWYLQRPRVRFAFEAGPLDSASLIYPEYPPEMSKRGKVLTGVALVMTVTAFIGSLLFSVEIMMRRSDAYKLALSEAASSPCVAAKVGHPFETGWMTEGGFSESAKEGSANFEIPIYGPKGHANLIVVAKKKDGAWAINEFSLVPSGGQPIQLLSASSCE